MIPSSYERDCFNQIPLPDLGELYLNPDQRVACQQRYALPSEARRTIQVML